MASLIKQFTKFTFPFKYDKDKIDATAPKIVGKNGERGVFVPFSLNTEGLRDGLDALLSENGGSSKIAECYRLDANARSYFELPKRKDEPLEFYSRQGGPFSVAITELSLFLFESGVGVLEFECEYKSDSLDDYVEANYFISEPKSNKNYFVAHSNSYNPETREKTSTAHTFTVKELISRVLASVTVGEGEACGFFDIKPVVFSYALLDECPTDVEVLLMHASKNYKDTYQLSADTFPVNVYRPFDNSYWAATMKGVINVSHLTDNEGTNDFFRDSFFEKTKRTYFALFLHVLHQKYATMLMLSRMGQLDRLGMNYKVMKSELLEAQKCRAEAYNVMFRAHFSVPSEQEHVNRFYENLGRTFRVNDLQNNFKNDIANLESICQTYVSRIKARDNKIKEKKNALVEIFVAIFGTLVGEIALIDSSWDLIEKLHGKTVDVSSPAVIALLATMLLPIVTIAIDVVKRVKDIIKINEDLKEEVENNLVEENVDKRK